LSSYVGTAQWQYILPNKRKAKISKPLNALDTQVALMLEDMRCMQSVRTASQATFLKEDARILEGIPDKSIDLVITSPPYANNYDYADAMRLEMTFWGEVNSWGDLHDTVRKFLIRSSSQHVSKDRLKLDSLITDPILEPIRDELIPVCKELEKVRETKAGNKAYHTMIAAYFIDMGSLSPSHKFGQQLGKLLEDIVLYDILKPRLSPTETEEEFCYKLVAAVINVADIKKCFGWI
jgi:hypothetical protein